MHLVLEGESSTFMIFVKNTFNTDVFSDPWEQVSFKIVMVIDTTKLYSLTLDFMTLTFTHVTGLWESLNRAVTVAVWHW